MPVPQDESAPASSLRDAVGIPAWLIATVVAAVMAVAGGGAGAAVAFAGGSKSTPGTGLAARPPATPTTPAGAFGSTTPGSEGSPTAPGSPTTPGSPATAGTTTAPATAAPPTTGATAPTMTTPTPTTTGSGSGSSSAPDGTSQPRSATATIQAWFRDQNKGDYPAALALETSSAQRHNASALQTMRPHYWLATQTGALVDGGRAYDTETFSTKDRTGVCRIVTQSFTLLRGAGGWRIGVLSAPSSQRAQAGISCASFAVH